MLLDLLKQFIQGSQFSATACENEIRINNILCATVSSSTTQITCKMGLNSGLVANTPYAIELLVKNVGYALQNDYYQINFLPSIISISKTQGTFKYTL